VIFVTSSVIGLAAGALGIGWIAAALIGVIGTTLATTVLCSAPPPPMPQVTNDSINWSLSQQLQAWHSIAWFSYCECVPGTPAPINFPPPNPVEPTGFPNYPTFPCDPADLCASIAAIRQSVFAIAQQQQQTAQLVTLLQRYQLPFAYSPGALHMALTGTGGFAISRLVGFQVNLQANPGLPTWPGNPSYVRDAGWMAISDSNGMTQEKRITRETFTWLPPSCQEATAFTYFLNPGVGVNIRELSPEI